MYLLIVVSINHVDAIIKLRITFRNVQTHFWDDNHLNHKKDVWCNVVTSPTIKFKITQQGKSQQQN